MKPTLSILIPTLVDRSDQFGQLRDWLIDQCPGDNDAVEILHEIDDRQISIGAKRNKLLSQAQGEYIVFVDDDDWISDDYVPRILGAIEAQSPDVIGIELIHTINGNHYGYTYHSTKYTRWDNVPNPNQPGTFYLYRCPNHLNPVRRDLALKVGFPDLRFGEDRNYSMRLLPYLKKETYLKGPVYFYREVSK